MIDNNSSTYSLGKGKDTNRRKTRAVTGRNSLLARRIADAGTKMLHLSWAGRLTIAGVALATLAAACGSSTATSKSTTQTSSSASSASSNLIPINIGLPNSNYWTLYVAREKGYFKQAGLDPTFFTYNSGAPYLAGLKSGGIQALYTGLATLFALQDHIPIKYLYTFINSSTEMALAVSPNSGINNFTQIAKAKAIATPTATCGEVSMALAAQKAGIPISSLHFVNLDPSLLSAAFTKGQADATFIWAPWWMNLQASGQAKIVGFDKDYEPGPGVCASNLVVLPSILKKYPTVGCRLIEADVLGAEEGQRDPGVAAETMVKVLGVTPEIAKKVVANLGIPSPQSQLSPTGGFSLTSTTGGLAQQLWVAQQALVATHAVAGGLSRSDIQQAMDPSPLQQFIQNPHC